MLPVVSAAKMNKSVKVYVTALISHDVIEQNLVNENTRMFKLLHRRSQRTRPQEIPHNSPIQKAGGGKRIWSRGRKSVRKLASTIMVTKAKDQCGKNQGQLVDKATAEQLDIQC